jgi:hypothetical protein
MKHIYSQAVRVRVWLGMRCERALTSFEPTYETEPSDRTLSSLKPFLDLEYCCRVWTVQESEVVEAIIFQAGDMVVGELAMKAVLNEPVNYLISLLRNGAVNWRLLRTRIPR